MNAAEVIKKNNYFTVVAAKKIPKGDIILKLQGTVSSSPNKYSIQIGAKKHLLPYSDDPQDVHSLFRFLNHSCDPNSYFDLTNNILIALKDISIKEEIVFHYCTTEYEMTSPFKCLCAANNCLSEIKGFKYLTPEVKKQLDAQSAPYLKIMDKSNL